MQRPLDSSAEARQIAQMNKNLPGLLPISLLMFTAMLAVWLGLAGPVDFSRLEKWQPLIGALITGAGILVASWNVTRQMRLTARSKEIDRLERDIPGMRDAHYFMCRIIPSASTQRPDADTLAQRLRRIDINSNSSAMIKAVEKALPATHDSLRREIIRRSYPVVATAEGIQYYERRIANLEELRRRPPETDPTADAEIARIKQLLDERRDPLANACDRFTTLREQIKRDIDTSQARLDKLRNALQKHIDD